MRNSLVELPTTYNDGYPAYGFSRVYSTLKTTEAKTWITDNTPLYEDAYREMMTDEAYHRGMDEYEYAQDIRASIPRAVLFNETGERKVECQKYDFEARSILLPDDFLCFLRNTSVPEINVSNGFHYSPQAIRTFMQVLLNPGIYTDYRLNLINEKFLYNEFRYFAACYLYNCNLITGRESNLIVNGNQSFLRSLVHSPDQLYVDSQDSLYNTRAGVYQDHKELAEDLKALKQAYPNAKMFLVHGKFNILPQHLGYLGLFQCFPEDLYKYYTSDEQAIFIVGCDSNKTLETFGNVPVWNSFARMSFLAQHPAVDFVFRTPDFHTKLDAYTGWAHIYRDLGINFVNIEDNTSLESKQRAQARWAGAQKVSLYRTVVYPLDPFIDEASFADAQRYIEMSKVHIRSSKIKNNMLKLDPLSKVAMATVHQLNEPTKPRKVNWNQRLNELRKWF